MQRGRSVLTIHRILLSLYNEGNSILWNNGTLHPDYMASHSRRQNSSQPEPRQTKILLG